jgi:hypothetical protein
MRPRPPSARPPASLRFKARPEEGLRQRHELMLLRWLGEQYAARVDQIALLLDLGERATRGKLAHLDAAGLVDRRRLLVDEPSWVTPTQAGLRSAGLPWRPLPLKIGRLRHVAAVNDVRLHVQKRAPDAQWVCERALASQRTSGEHLPDAVVVLDGQQVAIEVELSSKGEVRLQAIVAELVARYDAVLYFCAPATTAGVHALVQSGAWPTLGMRPLPDSRRAALQRPDGPFPRLDDERSCGDTWLCGT